MRIYVRQGNGVWSAVAPEVPGIGLTGHENWATREEAIERCRSLIADEIAAYARLGTPLELSEGDEIIDWTAQWWLIPEVLVPLKPAQLRAVLLRIDDLAAEVETALDALPAERWDRRRGTEWSVRTALDHLASGMGVGLLNLEPLPLDPVAAQAASLAELCARLRQHADRPFTVEQFGTNDESRRIRWTPSKVTRVVRRLQAAWSAHLSGGEVPGAFGQHDDQSTDDAPVTAAEIDRLEEADRALRPHGRARLLTYSYRYYRDRLTPWPDSERDRWRAMHRAFRDRVAAFDETELARVRVLPLGTLGPLFTVRGELRIAVAHVRGHIAQIRAAGAES